MLFSASPVDRLFISLTLLVIPLLHYVAPAPPAFTEHGFMEGGERAERGQRHDGRIKGFDTQQRRKSGRNFLNKEPQNDGKTENTTG